MALCADPLTRGCLTDVHYDGSWRPECQALRVAGKTPADFAHPAPAPVAAPAVPSDSSAGMPYPDPYARPLHVETAERIAPRAAGEDITANYHRGNPESVQAHADTPPETRERQRARVVNYIRDHGPATCDEVMAALDMTHQACSPRFTELRRDGVLVHTGERRNTRSGRPAAVHALAPDREPATT